MAPRRGCPDARFGRDGTRFLLRGPATPSIHPLMTGPEVIDLAREGIWVMILVGAPMMVVGLIVGIVIALFQALTQIQEVTLVFVPKIIAIFITLLIALPFMGATLGGYMERIAQLIVSIS